MGAINFTLSRIGIVKTIILCVFVANKFAYAQTCPNTLVAGDQDIWDDGASYMSQNWYRDMFAAAYNLHKGDWDSGWGWSKHNNPNPHLWEFPKMMSSGRLLWSGIDSPPGAESLLSQGAWTTANHSLGATTNAQPYPVLRSISRTENEVDILYMDSERKLTRVLYSGSPWIAGGIPPLRRNESVSDILAHPKNSYTISSPPEIGNNTTDTLEIVARDGRELIHFRWSRASGWSALEPTQITARPAPVNGSYRYFIASKPIVLRRSNNAFDVFALDDFDHLIHYQWDDYGWIAEDVTHSLQDNFRLVDDPVPVLRNDGTIDVFGRDAQGRLIYYKKDPNGAWSSEEITLALDGLATNEKIDSQPAVVYLDNQGLLVFYRVGYKLFIVAKAPPFINWVKLRIANDYAIISDPIVVKRNRRAVHGFARDLWTNNLVHFYLTPELGLGAERISPSGIDDDPTIVVTNENRLDLFARNSSGQLIHLYWAQSGGWRNENIHLTPGVSPTFSTVNAGRTALIRGNSALQVFGERLGFSSRTIIFSSALGPAVSAWHSNEEYWLWASGSLRGFKYQPANSNTARANAFRAWWLSDRVEMECPIFVATPASRAGTMLHESTHMIFWEFPHQANLPGSACGDPCSDNWIFHGARDPAGILTTTPNHSMNQVQIEYLTDISQFPLSWTTANVFTGAQAEANNRMNNRILNPPGWTPGLPRPLN